MISFTVIDRTRLLVTLHNTGSVDSTLKQADITPVHNGEGKLGVIGLEDGGMAGG